MSTDYIHSTNHMITKLLSLQKKVSDPNIDEYVNYCVDVTFSDVLTPLKEAIHKLVQSEEG